MLANRGTSGKVLHVDNEFAASGYGSHHLRSSPVKSAFNNRFGDTNLDPRGSPLSLLCTKGLELPGGQGHYQIPIGLSQGRRQPKPNTASTPTGQVWYSPVEPHQEIRHVELWLEPHASWWVGVRRGWVGWVGLGWGVCGWVCVGG